MRRTGLFVLWLGACAKTTPPVAAPADEPVRVENGRMYYADGTYAQVLAPEHVPTEPLVQGVLTWTYAGQARFREDPPRASGPSPYRIGGRGQSPLESLYDTVRVDHLGREWVVTAVDRDLLCQRSGQDPARCDVDKRPKREPVERGMWYPQSAQ